MNIAPKFRPVLDPEFVPACLWNRAFREAAGGNGRPLAIALERSDGSVSVFRTSVSAHDASLNRRYAERLLKYLLWQKGGYRVTIAGDSDLAAWLRGVYSPDGARAFDYEFMGDRVYGHPMEIVAAPYDAAPQERETAAPLGRHLEGCRIGFDLGASDRKCAAVIDGKVVFSDEVPWTPAAQADPQYHFDGIHDSLQRAAAHLPRVDAIGGSAAGVYVNNEVRVGSLYRSVPRDVFDRRVRRLFFELQKAWGGIPFDVVNDGEVTALAGSMALDDGAVLGIAMGSSLAAGYVTPQGAITTWLNELAFVPVDYREGARSTNGRETAAWERSTSRSRPSGGCSRPPASSCRRRCRCRSNSSKFRNSRRRAIRAPCASMTASESISAITSRLTPTSTRFAICWCSGA